MDIRFANHDPQKADAVKVRAGIVNVPGAEPLVGWLELPSRSPGITLLKVIAAPLNPLDLLIASGTFHSVRHESSYVPGSECVGVVIDSDRFAQGTLVYAECHASPTKTVLLENIPEAWRGQTTSPHAKYAVLPSQAKESRR